MISILCSNCKTPYTVPDNLAGKTVTCKHCGALLDVPSPLDRRPASTGAATAYERVLGKQNPVPLEILGIHGRFNSDGGAREITKLILSFRHLILLVALIALWIAYAQSADSAEIAAPLFLAAAILLLIAGWTQISMTSRKLAAAIGGQSSNFLSHILSSFLLISSDWRAAMPALRTFFLAILALIAAFSLASTAGGLRYLLPVRYLPSFPTAPPASQPSETPVEPAPSETPTPAPTVQTPPTELPPTPPTSQQTPKPIPPSDDSVPIPPPP